MPYSDISELNDTIKNILPEEAQEIFVEHFNYGWRNGVPERDCFRYGWSAVKRAGYVKGSDGKWLKASWAPVRQVRYK